MGQDTGTARNTYFGNLRAKNKRNRTVDKMDLAESAFDLLQWAQYGDVPEFKAPVAEAKHEIAEVKQQSSQESEEFDEDVVLDESAFEAEEEGEAWAKSVVEAASKDPLMNLEEMPEPEGFKGVTLRPYQRQALSWMWKRETDAANRDVVEQELKLLSELARNKAATSSSYVDPYQQNKNAKEIHCDCGPVLVSDAGIAKSTTLSGDINPVTHPLWQRRFLACNEAAISFYVNELLGVASAEPPRPPKQCVGGIQADAMGLGKTVMILALLLKSKQGEKSTGTTLVVAPLSLIAQWEEELGSKTNLTHIVYYGDSSKSAISKSSFDRVDVVVTTCTYIRGACLPFVPCAKLASISQTLQTELFKENCLPSTRRTLQKMASWRTNGFASF